MAKDISGTNNDVQKRPDYVQAPLRDSRESFQTSRRESASVVSAKYANEARSQNEQCNESPSSHSVAWYKESRSLGLGEVNRYSIEYTATSGSTLQEFFFRLKNMEKTGLRAIHLVNGPFILYCHIVPGNYDPKQKFEPTNLKENNEVCFKNTIKPGQTFNVALSLNSNSLIRKNDDGSCTYGWHCDIISQLVLNRKATISYTLMIGDNLEEMRRVNRSALTALSKGDFSQVFEPEQRQAENINHDAGAAGLRVMCSTTDEIWQRKPQYAEKPIHLVIITHGIFSNLTADMLYLRDAIMSVNSSAQNFLVDGFRGNAGKTEKGIRRLGEGVGTYTVKLIEQLEKDGVQVRDISFVGHSLGGPVQLYALRHILQTEKSDYFERKNISLKHFVCMASPMLGILSEMSLMISWFLDLGTLGKTGRDLTLSKKLPTVRKDPQKKAHWEVHSSRPVLETLPDEPVASVLGNFESRTVYANAVNDGIVPLRTSALLYLDWEALGDIRGLKDGKYDGSGNESGTENTSGNENDRKHSGSDNRGEDNHKDFCATDEYEHGIEKQEDGPNESGTKADKINRGSENQSQESEYGGHVGQVPEDSNLNVSEKYTTFLARIFNFDFEGSKEPPHKRKRIRNRIKRYAKITVKSSDMHTSDPGQEELDAEMGEVSGDEQNEAGSFNIPPKASAVESALSSMICPIPSRDFINDPAARPTVIFHDKYYHFQRVPNEHPKTGNFNKFFRYHEWRMDKQVKIAAKYHGPKLSWRKVLVKLPPDAHNNIVVRRRFANGYGWGVVDHLKNHVFSEDLKAKF